MLSNIAEIDRSILIDSNTFRKVVLGEKLRYVQCRPREEEMAVADDGDDEDNEEDDEDQNEDEAEVERASTAADACFLTSSSQDPRT